MVFFPEGVDDGGFRNCQGEVKRHALVTADAVLASHITIALPPSKHIFVIFMRWCCRFRHDAAVRNAENDRRGSRDFIRTVVINQDCYQAAAGNDKEPCQIGAGFHS